MEPEPSGVRRAGAGHAGEGVALHHLGMTGATNSTARVREYPGSEEQEKQPTHSERKAEGNFDVARSQLRAGELAEEGAGDVSV